MLLFQLTLYWVTEVNNNTMISLSVRSLITTTYSHSEQYKLLLIYAISVAAKPFLYANSGDTHRYWLITITINVSWSSKCSLKESRKNPPSAITNTVQEVVVITVYYKDSQGQRMCCNNRCYYRCEVLTIRCCVMYD